jgi:hypothetical protein
MCTVPRAPLASDGSIKDQDKPTPDQEVGFLQVLVVSKIYFNLTMLT